MKKKIFLILLALIIVAGGGLGVLFFAQPQSYELNFILIDEEYDSQTINNISDLAVPSEPEQTNWVFDLTITSKYTLY